jgi:hypothetical protein
MENAAQPTVRFGDWIGEGWKMFTEQWKAWVVHMLVFFGLVFVPAGLFGFLFALGPLLSGRPDSAAPLLFIPLLFILIPLIIVAQVFLMAGMYQSAFKQLRGGRIELGDLFSGRDNFLPILGATLLIGVMMMIGAFLCVIPMFIVMGMFFFTIPLIIDRRMGVFDAMQASRSLTSRDLIMFTLFAFLVYLIAQAGAYACYIGLLVTMPLQYTITAVAYRDCFGMLGAKNFIQPAPDMPDTYVPPMTYQQPRPDVFAPPQPPPPPPQPSSTFACSNCQMELPQTATFCPRCGARAR